MQKTMTLSGGCLCGAVQYQWRGAAVSATYCHCPDCRRATGGPYTVGVRVDAPSLTICSGTTTGYPKIADSGRQISREYCRSAARRSLRGARSALARSGSRPEVWMCRRSSSRRTRHGRKWPFPGRTSIRASWPSSEMALRLVKRLFSGTPVLHGEFRGYISEGASKKNDLSGVFCLDV